MRLGRIILILAVVLLLGTLAIFVALRFLGGTGGGEPTQEDLNLYATQTQQVIDAARVQVLVLRQAVPRGTMLTEDLIGVMDYRRDLVQDRFILTVDDKPAVIGKYAKFDLGQDMYLTDYMLSDTLVGSEASQQIEANKVAIAIPVDRFSSVAYGLQPGDHVDVIVTFMLVDLDSEFQTALPNQTAGVLMPGPTIILEGGLQSSPTITNLTAQVGNGGAVSPRGRAELDPVLNYPVYLVPSEAQRPRVVSQMLMQNVVVLYVGEFPRPEERQVKPTPTPAPQEGQQEGQQEGAPAPTPVPELPRPDIITLVVSPQEAVTLNYLLFTGSQLNLVMRSPKDFQADLRFTDAVTLGYLMNIYSIPVPAKMEYGLSPRVDALLPIEPVEEEVAP